MGGAGESISLAAPEGMDFPALAPEDILQTIRRSPSGRYLMEQRGRAGVVAALRRYGR